MLCGIAKDLTKLGGKTVTKLVCYEALFHPKVDKCAKVKRCTASQDASL